MLYQKSDINVSLWIGFVLCTFSYLAIISIVYLDWRQEILIRMKEIVNSNAMILVESETPVKSVHTLPRVSY